MSDPLHHECAVAAIRMLKPLSYYAEKYGNPLWAFNKLFLLMEKQHNRGQDGAGIGCIKLNTPLGEPYMFRHRDATGNALSNIFSEEQRNYRTLCVRGDIVNENPEQVKARFNYGGELLVGHMRYGASSARFDEGICHPFTRRTNWITRTLMLLGNFGITNAQELAQTLIERGQHPVCDSDTQIIMEEIGFYLDEAHNELYRSLRGKLSGQELQEEISNRIDLYDIMGKASKNWDGGFTALGAVGNGDLFCLRDPHGIRPCHYVLTDEYLAIASEEVPLMSVMEVEQDQVQILPPANMLVLKHDGAFEVREYTQPLEHKPCCFESIYFSRGNDPIIYRQRKKLGALLSDKVVRSLEGDVSRAAISFIPNTAEISYYGLLEGLRAYRRNYVTKTMKEALANGSISDELIEELILRRWPRAEKIVHKDIKLRTFITPENSRGQLASQVYDLTFDALREGEVLVAIDDSIVRGTTLKKNLLRLLARSKPRKIVIVSSAPQVRYPDCYGIDMSELGKFIAFHAAVALLKKRGMYDLITQVYEECKKQLTLPPPARKNPVKKIYELFTDDEITDEVSRMVTPEDSPCPVEVIYQSMAGLHEAIAGPCGDWYFSGDYPTPGGYTAVNLAFIRWYEGKDGGADALPV